MSSFRVASILLLSHLAVFANKDAARALEPSTPGAVIGSVADATTGSPLPGASVLLEGAELEAVSDSSGRFAFEGVPIGTYRLLVKLDGFAPTRQTDIVVNAGRDTEATIALVTMPQLRESVEVTASTFIRPPDVANGAFVLGHEEIRRAPGALGDVGRMIQAMPGMAARDDQRNDIVARGGNPIENLTIVDGLEVPNINHFAAQGASGGPITMLNAELISDATFLAGGFPAPYGSRISSVLDLALREGNRRRHQAALDLSMGGAGFIVEGPLSSRGSYIASARRSYVDLIAGPFGLTTIPHYSNYQAKLVFDLDRSSRLIFVSLGGKDDISFKTTDSDTDLTIYDLDDEGWRVASGLSYQRFFGSRATLTLSGSWSSSAYRMEMWDPALSGQLIAKNDSLDEVAVARAELTARLGPLGVLRMGGVTRHFGGRLVLAQPLGMENAFSVDPTRIHAYDTDVRPDEWESGGHVQLTRKVGALADVTLGARIDSYSTSSDTLVTPRASVVVHATPTFDLSASYGRFNQAVPLAFALGLPENRALSPIRSEQTVVGLAWVLRPGLRMSVEAYDKRYEDYPVSTEFPFLSLAALGGYYGAGEALMPGTSDGTGRVRGVEFFVQQKLTDSLYGQLSYAFSETRHRALDGVPRSATFDLPHVFGLVAGYRLDTRYEFSTRYTYTSGRPQTPLMEEASQEQNRTIFDATRLFEVRGPYYSRLDLRADRRFHRRWGSITTYVEVENAFDRKNAMMDLWNPKTKKLDTLPQLRLLAMGGVTVRF